MSSHLEDTLALQFRLAGTPIPEREYRALPGRRFKWDFAWPSPLDGNGHLLLEVQGGTFAQGKSGHSSGMGVNRDCEKSNLATLAGWRVLAVDAKQIQSGQALRWVQEALGMAA